MKNNAKTIMVTVTGCRYCDSSLGAHHPYGMDEVGVCINCGAEWDPVSWNEEIAVYGCCDCGQGEFYDAEMTCHECSAERKAEQDKYIAEKLEKASLTSEKKDLLKKIYFIGSVAYIDYEFNIYTEDNEFCYHSIDAGEYEDAITFIADVQKELNEIALL